MIICSCKNISESELSKIIKENSCKSVNDVAKCCQAGKQCGKCVSELKRVTDEVLYQ